MTTSVLLHDPFRGVRALAAFLELPDDVYHGDPAYVPQAREDVMAALQRREHLRTHRGWHRIQDQDRPTRTPRSTESLLQRAHRAGAHIGALCDQIHRSDGEPGVRRILGVLALARKHGLAVVDAAAQAALELGSPSYRFVRVYLERLTPPALTLRQVDPLIRQLTLYRDFIDRQTGDPT